MEKIRTRFAPSPTGFMHLGGLRTALYCYLYAKKQGGDFILRIEDTDQERFVEGAIDVIYSSLKESGIHYDEGPDKGGDYGPYVQSERKSIYLEYAKKLVELGGAYYCFCSKERLETLTDANGNRKYDKHCLNLSKEEIQRRLDAGEPYVIRQNIPLEGKSSYDDMVFGTITVDYAELEDNILITNDGAVNLSKDYLSSTPKYNLMYDTFGWERPHYIHLPIIMKDATRKLSKRYGDANFDDFVNKGYLPEAIVNYVALLGWSPKENVEKMTMEQMIELFSLDGVSKSPSIFDDVKLRWLNGEYLKELSDEEFARVAEPFFAKSKVYGKYDLLQLSALLKSRVEILSDIPSKIDFLEEFGEYDVELFYHKKMKTDKEVALTVLPWIREKLENAPSFDHDTIHDLLIGLATEKEMKNGQILWPARVALSGKDVTPGGAIELAVILGKEESLRRIDFSLELLKKA